MIVLYILLALIVLLVLITVHEFGHYCAGKIFGFKINEFSVGFGPKLYQRTKKDGEKFSIRALPLGGYCAFEGEDEDGKDRPGAFNTMPGWKRLIVLLSGVAFNFLFGVLVAVIYLLVAGFSTAKITSTVPSQTALQRGDIVVSVNGKTVEAYRSFNDMLAKCKEGEDIVITVNRDGKIEEVTTKREKLPAFYFVSYDDNLKGKLWQRTESGEVVELSSEAFADGIIGLSTAVDSEKGDNAGKGGALKEYLANIYSSKADAEVGDASKSYGTDENIKLLLQGDQEKDLYASITYAKSGVGIGVIQQAYAEKYGFFESVGKAWPFCFHLCGLILSSLAGLFTGAVSLAEAGGTITAVSQIAQISSWGIDAFLLLIPLLAMNLALFNILPIPSLDGARAIFVLIEMIFRKPVPRKIEGLIHTIGLFVLLALVVFLDINHIVHNGFGLMKLLL